MSKRRFVLQPTLTLTAAQLVTASNVVHGTPKYFGVEGVSRLSMALYVSAHDNTNSNETYQFNLTTGMVLPSGLIAYWDLGAFVVVSGADAIVVDIMHVNGMEKPTSVVANATVTSIASNQQLGTDGDTRGAITTAVVNHGTIGEFISYTLETGGTSPGPITFEIAGLVWS